MLLEIRRRTSVCWRTGRRGGGFVNGEITSPNGKLEEKNVPVRREGKIWSFVGSVEPDVGF